jgi:DNA-binding MarR family transcriptional regulator
MVRCDRSISSNRRNSAIATDTHSTVVDEVIAGYEALMQQLADTRAPEFLEIDITMPQAKLLYLLGALGELHMSQLVQRLGVSLSTISGLVDRLVDHGLVIRREDPVDRRQVLVGLTDAGRTFIDRFRELNARQMRALLEQLDDADLDHVRTGLVALGRAAARLSPSDQPSPGTTPASAFAATRKDPA